MKKAGSNTPYTQTLDKDVIEGAAKQATSTASSEAMSRIPKTAAGFEKDFNQLKKDMSHIYQYLKNIPYTTIVSIFKSSEVQSETFSIALNSMTQNGLDRPEETIHCAEFLIAWSSASSFDMIVMMLEDNERTQLKQIANALEAGSKLRTKFEGIYCE
jgi:hypothetical protein